MSLRKYKPQTKSLPLGTETIIIRGLSTSTIATLIQSNLEEFGSVFGAVEQVISSTQLDTADDLAIKSMESTIIGLAKSAPNFLSAAIALSVVDEDESGDLGELIEIAATIPMPKQVTIMLEILNLTFTEVGGIKKFIAQIGQEMQSLKPAQQQSSEIPKEIPQIDQATMDKMAGPIPSHT